MRAVTPGYSNTLPHVQVVAHAYWCY
jgi:hypothetical protein